MGISLELYRARIGRHRSIKDVSLRSGYRNFNSECNISLLLCMTLALHFSLIQTLLIIGCVEPHPGPTNEEVLKDLSELKEMMRQSMTDNKNSSNSITNRLDELNTKISAYDQKLEVIQADLDSANNKITELEKCNSYLVQKIDDLECKNKSNNIILFGVNECTDAREDVEYKVTNILKEHCKLSIDSSKIENCFRLGKRDSENTRPILVILNSIKTKLEILKSSKLLKGTSIFISQDYTPKVREKRQFLHQCARKAIESGHTVKIFNDGIKVNNDMYFKTEELSNDEWLFTCNAKVLSPTYNQSEAQHKRYNDSAQTNDNPKKRLRSNSVTNIADLNDNTVNFTNSSPSSSNIQNKTANVNKNNQGNFMPPPSRGRGRGGCAKGRGNTPRMQQYSQ